MTGELASASGWTNNRNGKEHTPPKFKKQAPAKIIAHNRTKLRKFTIPHKAPLVIISLIACLQSEIDALHIDAELGKLFYHHDKNGRKRRSQGVESIVMMVLCALLSKLNLKSLTYGLYTSNNTLHCFSYKTLKADTGLPDWTIDRAIAVLKKLNIVTVTPVVKKTPKGLRVIKTVIEFTDKIFKITGLEDQYLKDLEYQTEKFLAKQARLDRNRDKRADKLARLTPFSLYQQKKAQKVQRESMSIAKQTRPDYKKPTKGNGATQVRDIQNLVAGGMSVPDAFNYLREKYKPPH